MTLVPRPQRHSEAVLPGEAGQAVIEFVFALLLLHVILIAIFVMFHFAEDTFFAIADARQNLLEDYHNMPGWSPPTWYAWWEQEPSTRAVEVEVELRNFPLLGAILEDEVGAYGMTFETRHGTKASGFGYGTAAVAAECAGVVAAVTVQTTSNNPSFLMGVGAGGALCALLWEY